MARGAAGRGYAQIDRTATAALAGIQPGAARTVAYPELNLNGRLVSLGAVDVPPAGCT